MGGVIYDGKWSNMLSRNCLRKIVWIVWSMVIVKAYEIDDPTEVEDGGIITPRLNILGTKYLKLEDQSWRLSSRAGHWALVFKYMDIEKSDHCQHDSLQIKVENGGSNNPITTFCGDQVPDPFISESPNVSVRFVSDTMFEFRGFKIVAFHSVSKDLLLPKIRTQPSQEAFTLAPAANHKKDNTNSEPTFYFLVASVGVALILFGILLLYFATLLRKRAKSSNPATAVYYNTPSGSESTCSSVSQATNEKSSQELLKTGRRYSRKMSDRFIGAEKAQPQVVLLTSESLPVVAQHNFIYGDSN
ncbi:cubilin-like [Mya arenaria]|uniref:cubilin-like n=1 Tax=Mya arenaria TaxID=6604 RepID=UPI0022E53516|nr:cubilin-like [Mya arenaria]